MKFRAATCVFLLVTQVACLNLFVPAPSSELVSDSSENSSNQQELSLTLSSPVAGAEILSQNGASVNITVSGTCTAGSTLVLSLDTTELSPQITCDDNGSFSQVVAVSEGSSTTRSFTVSTSNGEQSISVTKHITMNWCPEKYLFVEGDNALNVSSFCVMKYEAKYGTHKPFEPRPDTAPVVTITYTDTLSACSSIGTGYSLVNNLQWMALSNDISENDLNWTGGTVGNGSLFRGHTDNSPAALQVASSDDNDGLSGTTGGADGAEQKRTHLLPSGETIWDLAGNAEEWVNWVVTAGKVSVVGPVDWSTIGTDTTEMPFAYFFPSFTTGGLYSAVGAGVLVNSSANTATAFSIRGGNYSDQSNAGLYALRLDKVTVTGAATIGFRCVYQPY